MLLIRTPNPWHVLSSTLERPDLGPERLINSRPALLLTDVLELSDHLLVSINLPGVHASSVTIELKQNKLSISAHLRNPEVAGDYLWRERPTGEVRRKIALPGCLNNEVTSASLELGVLTVRVDKIPELLRRTIVVRSRRQLKVSADVGVDD